MCAADADRGFVDKTAEKPLSDGMKTITASSQKYCDEAASHFKRARRVIALTGAGISVESGIDDFRSPGGLWSKYPPEEYATLEAFRRNPEKSWKLFRELGRGLVGRKPNGAHRVLADLESHGLLRGVVTQNIDNLHQDSGSMQVLEIHGNHRFLHCIGCGDVSKPPDSLLEETVLPRCRFCGEVVKPDVVLFGENVRSVAEIEDLLHRCDLIMVIGTSAQVYPAAALPQQVKSGGGMVYEFNLQKTSLSEGDGDGRMATDYFFQGSASHMLELFRERLELAG